MKAVAFHSIKGGVGKTSLSVNFAAWLAEKHRRTLLIDLDPQGAAGYLLGLSPRANAGPPRLGTSSIKEGWAGNAIRESNHPSLDVLPSDLAWRSLSSELHSLKKPRKALRRLLSEIGEPYDAVILDCPPGIDLLAENVFRATDILVEPVVPSPLATRAIELLTAFFGEAELPVGILHPVFSMVQERKRLHRSEMERLRKLFPAFLPGGIPFSIEIENMGALRRAVIGSGSESGPALAIAEICSEIERVLFASGAASGSALAQHLPERGD